MPQKFLSLLGKSISPVVGIVIIILYTLLVGGVLFWNWSELEAIKVPQFESLDNRLR